MGSRHADGSAHYRSISRMTATRKVLQRYLNKYDTDGSPHITPQEESRDVMPSRCPTAYSNFSEHSYSQTFNVVNDSPRSSRRCHHLSLRLGSGADDNLLRCSSSEHTMTVQAPESPGNDEKEEGFEDMEDVDFSMIMKLREQQQKEKEMKEKEMKEKEVCEEKAEEACEEEKKTQAPVEPPPPEVTPPEPEPAQSECSTSPVEKKEEKDEAKSGGRRRRRSHKSISIAPPPQVSFQSAIPPQPSAIPPPPTSTPTPPVTPLTEVPPPPPQSQETLTPADFPHTESDFPHTESDFPYSESDFPLDKQIDKVAQLPRYSTGHINHL